MVHTNTQISTDAATALGENKEKLAGIKKQKKMLYEKLTALESEYDHICEEKNKLKKLVKQQEKVGSATEQLERFKKHVESMKYGFATILLSSSFPEITKVKESEVDSEFAKELLKYMEENDIYFSGFTLDVHYSSDGVSREDIRNKDFELKPTEDGYENELFVSDCPRNATDVQLKGIEIEYSEEFKEWVDDQGNMDSMEREDAGEDEENDDEPLFFVQDSAGFEDECIAIIKVKA